MKSPHSACTQPICWHCRAVWCHALKLAKSWCVVPCMAQDSEAAEKNHQRVTDILEGLLDETSARRDQLGDSIAGEGLFL